MTTRNGVSPRIEIDDVGKDFVVDGRPLVAIDSITLDIETNAFVSIVGTSGCGKSTLLDIVAGLTEPTWGEVRTDGVSVRGPGRDRGVVFQSYSLFEWMSVEANIRFALDKSDLSSTDKDGRVAHFVRAVGLSGFEKAFPKQLSGGMRQRVAIARALVYRPSILLMDEPFGALDAQTRGMMQELLLEVWEAHRVTVLFVTHDVDEAIFLSDRVVVLASRPGRIKSDVRIELDRPRSFELLTTPEFMAYKRRILADIREETLKLVETKPT